MHVYTCVYSYIYCIRICWLQFSHARLNTGEPPIDLWEFDIARFSPFSANKQYLKHRSKEVLGRHYMLAYPNWEIESGRGMRRTPMYSTQEGLGASWGCVHGWERANWYGNGLSGKQSFAI